MPRLNNKQKLLDIIDNIKLSLAQHNGSMDLVSYDQKKGVVTITLQGACAHCQLSDLTLKYLIESQIRTQIPSIKEVRVV